MFKKLFNLLSMVPWGKQCHVVHHQTEAMCVGLLAFFVERLFPAHVNQIAFIEKGWILCLFNRIDPTDIYVVYCS